MEFFFGGPLIFWLFWPKTRQRGGLNRQLRYSWSCCNKANLPGEYLCWWLDPCYRILATIGQGCQWFDLATPALILILELLSPDPGCLGGIIHLSRAVGASAVCSFPKSIHRQNFPGKLPHLYSMGVYTLDQWWLSYFSQETKTIDLMANLWCSHIICPPFLGHNSCPSTKPCLWATLAVNLLEN